MQYILSIIIITTLSLAQEQNYIWPTDASKTVTAFFGEMRPHRYHTGIDIRTFGVNGKEIYAIDDGYVYRIGVSNNKYGNVLYIKLQDGNIAVYSHLSKFNPIIQRVAHQVQNKQQSYTIDYYLEAGLINVEKGDIVGYTGDTGGLSGPHLHFEIRDQINQPINPFNTNLKDFFFDNIAPIPQSIAFIPKSDTTIIEGTYFTKKFNLNKIDDNNYNLLDTINIIGDFGIALKIIDQVNGQPFKYGIYSLELLIDSISTYKINFDMTSFNQSNQLYIERDYELFSREKDEYYRLFKSEFGKNYFIEDNSSQKNNSSSGLHAFKVIAADINNNKTQISGYFRAKELIKPEKNYYQLNNGSWKIDFKGIQKIYKVNAHLFNKENISEKIEPLYDIVNDTSLVVHNVNNTYDVLEFDLNTLNGKTSKEYILLNTPPQDINGNFFINHNEEGIIVNFIEDVFSNKSANLKYRKNGILHSTPMIRSAKNILSSELFSFNDFLLTQDIYIEYDFDYIVSKKMNIEKMATYPNLFSQKTFKNGQIIISHQKETFFDSTIVYITQPFIKNFNNESIISPFYIGPSSTPFNKPLGLSLFLPSQKNLTNMVVCSYDDKNKEWIPLETALDSINNILETQIRAGSIVGVIKDTKKPKIHNIVPRNNATYLMEDLNNFNIKLTDDFSGVNYQDGIKLFINGKSILTGFNLYQEKLIAYIKENITIGKNTYELTVYDNANNKSTIKGSFFIKEK